MKIKIRYWIELLIITICIFLAYFYLVYSSDIVKTLRYRCSDFLFGISNHITKPPQAKDKLTIIAIDEKSLSNLKINLPLKRNFITKIIKKLKKYEPQLIFLNFLLSEEKGKEKDTDLVFASAIKKSQNVALPIYYDIVGNRLGPLNIFERVSYKTGFINKIRDWDSSIRRCMLFHLSRTGKIDEYALELAIASESKGIKENELIANKIPVQKDGSMYINYQIRPEQLTTVSLEDFMKRKIDPYYLKDKIVIVADVTETGSTMYNTPLGLMSGIYIFTNELIMFLSEKYITPLNLFWQMFLAFLLMLCMGLITLKVNINKSFSYLLVLSSSIFIFSILLFQKGYHIDYFSLIFPCASVFIIMAFFRFLVLLEEKIDELKEANIRLKTAQQELIKKEQLSTIGKMTAKILHEIKGPLANIKSSIDIIKSTVKENPKSFRIAQLAGDEINRMFELSQQLRDTYTPHLEDLKTIDINTILKDAVEISQKRFQDKGVQITIQLTDTIPIIKVSPSKIKQVFINILNNAFEVASPGGKVKVSSELINNNISIIFYNNGSEISKETIPKIFDAFFSTKKESGSGLGLFICKEIIKAHNGDITVKSSKEEGTAFTVLLPI